MKKFLAQRDARQPMETVQAHCDVPCGIYDPIVAQIDALTVVRMVDLIEAESQDAQKPSMEQRNKFARLTYTKEVHAEKCKHEIRVIWGDFIKAAHVEKHPELHSLVHEIMQLGSENKQHVSREAAVRLLDKVNAFAEIFWAIKGEATVKAKAPYAPNLELVYRKV